MNPNQFTIKSQEAIAAAQQLAFDKKSPSMDTCHLLQSMLEVDKDYIPYLLNQFNIDTQIIQDRVRQIIDKLPVLGNDDVKYPSQK